ncbi:SAM-dependent methyltransferase [Hydrogenophaga sp. 5NK40-0174]|uniref:SAM-dependent methyltransferase n=1 Tax=Hydrogenophaga sp. 5NK40-0174 TaxID=3127649 RepID=UPI00334192C3
MNSTHTDKQIGQLFLVPTPLDFGCEPDGGSIDQVLPFATLQRAAGLTHWITENAKSTRAFLKRVEGACPLALPIQALNIQSLPRQTHKKGDHLPEQVDRNAVAELLRPLAAGEDMGLVSEAGMPAIADPGSSLVRAAHDMGAKVVPLVGPVSLMLALAASGLNGQQFAFVGYLPQQPAERAKRLKELEQLATRSGQTQVCIETPYRNKAWLETALHTLSPETRLATCSGLTITGVEECQSRSVAQWRKQVQLAGSVDPLASKLPTVFLIGR